MDINQIYRQDSPGVVDITVISQQSSSFGFFGGTQQTEDEGAGVVYDKHGDILTDQHVVAGATAITVKFPSGKQVPAKLVGTDSSTDVGVIKVDAPSSELEPLQFADSNEAQIGAPVIAIGSPFEVSVGTG